MGLLTGLLIASAIKGAAAITESVAEAAAARSNERAAEASENRRIIRKEGHAYENPCCASSRRK